MVNEKPEALVKEEFRDKMIDFINSRKQQGYRNKEIAEDLSQHKSFISNVLNNWVYPISIKKLSEIACIIAEIEDEELNKEEEILTE